MPALEIIAMTVRLMLSALVCGGLLAMAVSAQAAGPRNPYSSFNLSGINYGAQQWERAQRDGRRVWPYYNTPGRTSSSSGISAGGAVGARRHRHSECR